MILLLLTAASLAAVAPPCRATSDAAGYLCRAVAAAHAEKFAEAGDAFDKAAISSSPGDARTQPAAEGDTVRARHYWQQAIAKDPTSVGGRAAQQALALADPAPRSPTPPAPVKDKK